MSDDEDDQHKITGEIMDYSVPGFLDGLVEIPNRDDEEENVPRPRVVPKPRIAGGAVQIGGTQHITFNQPAAHITRSASVGRPAEDPRQVFLGKVRDLALTEASSAARFARVFMSLGAVIVLVGGALAVLRVGISHGTSTGWVTALGGVLVGTVGGAFRLHANHERKNLDREATKVVEELHADHSRKEALVLIDRVDDPVLRDRLRSITAMRTLGLAPGPDEVANRVFPPSGHAKAQIEPPAGDE